MLGLFKLPPEALSAAVEDAPDAPDMAATEPAAADPEGRAEVEAPALADELEEEPAALVAPVLASVATVERLLVTVAPAPATAWEPTELRAVPPWVACKGEHIHTIVNTIDIYISSEHVDQSHSAKLVSDMAKMSTTYRCSSASNKSGIGVAVCSST